MKVLQVKAFNAMTESLGQGVYRMFNERTGNSYNQGYVAYKEYTDTERFGKVQNAYYAKTKKAAIAKYELKNKGR